MTSKEEIASQLNAMQQAKAKVQVYKDVIASVAKYEQTLMRKHGEAKKRCERLAKQGKTSQAYLSAVSDSVLLSIKTVEAQKMRAALMEVCIEITGDYIAQEEALVKLSKQIDKEEDKGVEG